METKSEVKLHEEIEKMEKEIIENFNYSSCSCFLSAWC